MTRRKKKDDILWAFFGSGAESEYALKQLARLGLEPALVISGKELPPELYNTPWDFFVVASYGKLLPKAVLDLPRLGALNIHPSLLPKFRGPSPILSAILCDERETGVTIMLMEERMDAGPVLAQARVEISQEEWPPPAVVLAQMLFVEGANLLAEILPLWLNGEITSEKQDESKATYTKKFTEDDSLIDPAGGRADFLKVRAFDRSPRAHFFLRDKRVIVTDATVENGTLKILKVIPEGKKEMLYADFLRGAGRAGSI